MTTTSLITQKGLARGGLHNGKWASEQRVAGTGPGASSEDIAHDAPLAVHSLWCMLGCKAGQTEQDFTQYYKLVGECYGSSMG